MIPYYNTYYLYWSALIMKCQLIKTNYSQISWHGEPFLIKLWVFNPIRDRLNVMFESQKFVCVNIKSVTTALLNNQMHNSLRNCFISIWTEKIVQYCPLLRRGSPIRDISNLKIESWNFAWRKTLQVPITPVHL